MVERELNEAHRKIAPMFAGLRWEESFIGALLLWSSNRDPARLVEWLRSDRPLSSHFRDELADAIEHVVLAPKTRKRGRPHDRELHGTLVAAKYVYRRWCMFNEANSVEDAGFRSAMKDQAIEIAIRAERREEVDPLAVRELWDRPKHRHK